MDEVERQDQIIGAFEALRVAIVVEDPKRELLFRLEEINVAVNLALRPAQESAWQPIETAPKDGGALFLACTADGRQMIFRGSILRDMMKPGTPDQLRFPATHWMPLPVLPQPMKESDA